MAENAVKTIVLLMVLVVLSVLVGAQVSDGLRQSVGAFAVIGGVAAFFCLLLMGKNAWSLVILLAPFMGLFPMKMLKGAMGIYTLSVCLLFYQVVQCVFMRQQRMKWHSLALFDVLYVVIILYMCVSYYRFPVLLDMLGDVEFVGAETYVHCIGTIFYFLLLCSLSIKSEELEKIIKWVFYVKIAFAVIRIILRMVTGHIYWDASAEEGEGGELGFGERRITLLAPIATMLLPYIYASKPFHTIITSPWRMAVALFSLFGISLAGSRGIMVGQGTVLIGISILKKEFGVVCVLLASLWFGCVLLSAGGGMELMPNTAQRMVSILPGVHVNREIEMNAQNSSEVRVIAWKMAFDTRAGYIHDYIMGDGFQLSRKEMLRDDVAWMRGTAKKIGMDNGNDTLASTGNWHNGFIATMHRLGLVGCALFYMMMFLSLALYMLLGRYYYGKPFFAYFCVMYGSAFNTPFIYSYNAQIPINFFDAFTVFVVLKLLYTLLREEGKLQAFVFRHKYVPLLIREHEQGKNAAALRANV